MAAPEGVRRGSGGGQEGVRRGSGGGQEGAMAAPAGPPLLEVTLAETLRWKIRRVFFAYGELGSTLLAHR
eukprot:2467201-Pyramimonas_sp.AAC.1